MCDRVYATGERAVKKQHIGEFAIFFLGHLAMHKKWLYTLVIGCRNVIAEGKPGSHGLKLDALAARHATVVSSTLLLWWI